MKEGGSCDGGGRYLYEGKCPRVLSIILVSTGHSWNHRRLAEFRLMSSFSFHARYALLTYAQCGDLCPFTIVDLLSTMGAECIIGREHHQDGGIHLHVFVDFGRKYRSRRADTFDVGGFHPNISQSYGTPEKGYDYACKDGDVVAGGLDRPVQLRAEEEIAKLILSGVKSHRQRLENHFGIWCMTWIQNLQSLALPNYRSIVIGNTDIVPRLRITSRSSI